MLVTKKVLLTAIVAAGQSRFAGGNVKIYCEYGGLRYEPSGRAEII